MAGGHSLLPMMKLRLAQPERADRHQRPHRAGLHPGRAATSSRIGAMTRHAELLDSAVARRALPDLPRRRAGDRRPDRAQPRARSAARCARPTRPRTCPRSCAALGATLVHPRPRRRARTVAVREFHLGPYETVVGPGEMLTEIRVPIRPGAGSAYEKVERRAGDWAVAAGRGRSCGSTATTVADVGIGLTAVGARALLRARGRGRACAASAPPRRTSRPRPALAAAHCHAVRRPARPRRLQAPPRRRAHPAGAAPRRGHAPTGRGGLTMQVTMTVNGDEVHARGRAAAAARALPARRARPDRHALGLRHVQLRHLRRAGWTACR